jgi:hypothetical protein
MITITNKREREQEFIKQQTFVEYINPNQSMIEINHQDQQDYYS